MSLSLSQGTLSGVGESRVQARVLPLAEPPSEVPDASHCPLWEVQ